MPSNRARKAHNALSRRITSRGGSGDDDDDAFEGLDSVPTSAPVAVLAKAVSCMANGFVTLLRVWTHHSFTVFVVSRLQGQGGIRFVPAFMVKNPKKTWPQSKPRSASIGISLTGKNGAPAQRLCRRRQRAGLGKSGDRVDGNARGWISVGLFPGFQGPGRVAGVQRRGGEGHGAEHESVPAGAVAQHYSRGPAVRYLLELFVKTNKTNQTVCVYCFA